MKLTDKVVKQFERDQKAHGTKVALHNFVWMIADELMRGVGVKRIKTDHK